MATRIVKPKVRTGTNSTDDIKIPYSVIYGAPDISAYSKTYVYYVTGDGKHADYDIEHTFGADVNVSVYLMGQSIFGETVDELVMVDVYTKLNKVKLVFASAPSSDMKFKVVITGVEHAPSKVLNNNSWDTIRKVVLAGKAADYWSVGDTKSITSKSGKTYTIRLVDLQDGRYEYSDGSGSSKAVFEFVECYNLNGRTGWSMNSTDTNDGGWENSKMRKEIMPTILADLPDDMVAAMSQVKVLSGIGGKTTTVASSSNNILFLPAEIELGYISPYHSIGVTESPLGHFDYYSDSINSRRLRIKYIVDSSNTGSWWQRSPVKNSPDNHSWLSTSMDGNISLSRPIFDENLAPIFAI